jgi:TM2 domain-containing membrane protein YozV
MNCAVHTDVPAVAYCRTCGKALCATCKHDVRGVIYCEDCIASRLHDAMPVAPGPQPMAIAAGLESGPNPAIAAFLGFIPGVGAMYNGQFIKGLIHVGIFASLIWGADHAGSADVFFGFGIAFWLFYMVFDAYKTAQARRMGVAAPDPFGFERLWGPPPPPPPTAAAVMPEGVPAGVPAEPSSAPPVGAIVLIVIGVLFLLNTLDIFHWNWIGRFWPVLLIVIGVWTWLKRRPASY